MGTNLDTLRLLDDAAAAWHQSARREREARRERDAAMVAARRAGAGVREIARTCELDPTLVSRILRREGL